MDKLKECISCGIVCDRSYQGCFNTSLKGSGCRKCLDSMLEEHDEIVRQELIAKMKEYKVVYRDGGIYKIIDKIFSEDSAYMILAMVMEAGYEDSRIEEV